MAVVYRLEHCSEVLHVIAECGQGLSARRQFIHIQSCHLRSTDEETVVEMCVVMTAKALPIVHIYTLPTQPLCSHEQQCGRQCVVLLPSNTRCHAYLDSDTHNVPVNG